MQRRSAATVACILDAAAHILERDGLAGLSTNAVARRAGTSIGSLYQYFPNRDAITAALILRSHEAIVAGMRALTDATVGLIAEAAIAALADMLVATEPASPNLSRILEAEEARLPKTDAVLEAEEEIEALNRAFFGRYVDPSGCDDERLAIVAADVIGIVRALLEAPRLPGEAGQADLRARILRTVTGYLAPLLKR